MKKLFALLILSSTMSHSATSLQASPQVGPQMTSHEASFDERLSVQQNDQQNRAVAFKANALTPVDRLVLAGRPVEDTADFAYVLMSSQEPTPEVANLRRTIAQNLPSGVKLVILADTSDVEAVRAEYQPLISAERLIIATDTDTGGGLWARDSFPIPVYQVQTNSYGLVSAHYYREFSSGGAIAQAVQAKHFEQQGFTFVGGNLLADEDGVCFSVNSYRLFTATESDLKAAYGCKTVHLMPHVRGLGDVDEVLKPLPGHRMLTNSVEYKEALESWGYQVILLPALPENYRTYINSLVVGKKVFMPSYGVAADREAQSAYEKLGFQVVPIESSDLSDNWHGSIHCQTMSYPRMDLDLLLKNLHLHRHSNQDANEEPK